MNCGQISQGWRSRGFKSAEIDRVEGALHLPASSVNYWPPAPTITARIVPKAPMENFPDLHVAFITLRKHMEIIWRH